MNDIKTNPKSMYEDIENKNNLQSREQSYSKTEKNPTVDPHENNKSWEQGYNFISRLFMMNLFSIALNIKRVLKKGLPISLQHLQTLKEDERCERNSETFIKNLEEVQGNSVLTPMRVFKSLISLFKQKCLIVFIYCFFDSSLKLFNSVALNFCIQNLIEGNKHIAYGWGAGMIGSMYFSSLFKQSSIALGMNLNTEIRGTLIYTIYSKINKLSNYAVKSANLGKVINLVSSDMNSTELKFFFLFNMVIGIYTLAAACVIFAFRLGPLGMLSIAFLILILPVQRIIGKTAAKYTSKRVQKSDERIKLINEIIEGIRIIKMYGWEEAMKKIVERIRKEEVSLNIKAQCLQYLERALSTSSVLICSGLTFIIIYYQGSYSLNSAKIFSSIELLTYIKTNVIQFSGQGFAYIFEFQIFLKRFIDIYNIQDITIKKVDYSSTTYTRIQSDEIARFDQFSSFWKIPAYQIKQMSQNNKPQKGETLNRNQETDALNVEDVKPTLKNLTLNIKKGQLLGVVGKVGCGKTTFLQTFLNEIPFYKGYYEVQPLNDQGKPLKMAFVEQEPYIFSGTVRENILFGSEFEERWYNTVIKNCCLEQDFTLMDSGDMTIIGERGVNLSGGQKARICLARAVYSDADLYLLDDPLSAVDSKVAKELFFQCIKGVLREKTVILVTHQIHFTRDCDKIAILDENGYLKKTGSFDELIEDLKILTAGQLKFENANEPVQNNNKLMNGLEQNISQSNKKSHIIKEDKNEKFEEDDQQKQADKKKEEKPKQIQIAKPENVVITVGTYARYLKLINKQLFLFPLWIFLLFAAAECAYTAYNRGLAFFDYVSDDSKSKLFGFWMGFACLYLVLNACKYIILSFGIQKGNQELHGNMMSSLTGAPVLFFDRTSSGSMMNKFSNDVSLLDNMLHFSSSDSLDIFSNFLNLSITCIVFTPYVVIPAVVEIFLLYNFMIYSKDIIIKIRQMDLVQKTPVFSHFNSTLQGVISIKVYGQNQAFQRKMSSLCNNSQRANMSFWLCSRFFARFIQAIAIICAGAGIFIIIAIPNSDANDQAQSLTYFMLMVDAVQWCLRQMITTDTVMNSYERTLLLVQQKPEAPLVKDFDNSLNLKSKESNSKNIWPSSGLIEFKNVTMKYSQELNPVLRGLNFSAKPGEKIGIVGRTGAGKSSILQALFRLTEAEEGSQIVIDGIDISKLGLHKLRENISIIPQIPFVFGGTIRRNLDPLSEYSDAEVWNALHCVELDKYIQQNCKSEIETDMTVAQSVFSVGQKQLICLARALLKKNKILVLDEATANVDMETDNLIQKTIRTKFQSSTVLTIAHRLNTIADYDKVMIMNEGVSAEYDQPYNLLASSVNETEITRDTIFAQMVKNTGINNSANIYSLAKNKFLEIKRQN